MSKIKIISGWGQPGGSTFSFINLCNLLNEKGHDCTFFTPHDWMLDKCKAGKMTDIKLEPSDTLIYHFLDAFKVRPPVKKFILSLHEKDLYDLRKKDVSIFDKIHFLNEGQKDWHEYKKDNFFLAPNTHEKLEPFVGDKIRCAGIIGNIDKNKNVHVSIQRALDDGHNKVRICGLNNDPQYFEEKIKPFLKGDDIVKYVGFIPKQDIYDLVTDVYHSSTSENASLVVDECKMTGVTLNGNDQTFNLPVSPNDEIYEIWKKELELV